MDATTTGSVGEGDSDDSSNGRNNQQAYPTCSTFEGLDSLSIREYAAHAHRTRTSIQ